MLDTVGRTSPVGNSSFQSLFSINCPPYVAMRIEFKTGPSRELFVFSP